MSAYQALAASYDELTYDIPYEKILTFWETLLRKNGVQPKSVLDLACGTGSLSVLMAQKGYQVLGADISEQMLTVAYEKAMQMEQNAPYFICQPMQKLRLPQRVDAVVCILDSINYVTKPQDCRKAFARVFEALNPGGLFVFDINTPAKLRSLDGQVFLDETEDTYCVWRAEFSEKKNICFYGMDVFQKQEDGAWERSREEHTEYAYSPQELVQYLQEAGFTQIRLYGDRKLREPAADEQRIYFSARKES